jgi:hypothetical protein
LKNLARCLKSEGRLIVMHLRGRAEINAFHRRVGGAVGGDFLPADDHWEKWLAEANMKLGKIIDSPELFFLRADVCRTG